MLFVFLERSDIQLIPLGHECLLLDRRVPIKCIAIFARRSEDSRSRRSRWIYWLRGFQLHMLHPESQGLVCGQAEVCYITLYALNLLVRNIDFQRSTCFHEQVLLLYIVRSYRGRECNLLFEINSHTICIYNMAYSLVSLRRFQCCQIHLQYGLTIEHILFAHLQYWSSTWIEELYWRRQYLFFCFQGNSLIGSQLEIYIISCHLIKEEASESFFHLTTCCDSPIIIQQDCAGRAVCIEVKIHIRLNSTIVLNYEVEFLVAVFHCIEVQIEPCLASLYCFASPIEVLCFCTSVVDNFGSLIHISRNSNLSIRQDAQIHIQTILHQLNQRHLTQITKQLSQSIFSLTFIN